MITTQPSIDHRIAVGTWMKTNVRVVRFQRFLDGRLALQWKGWMARR